MAVLGALRPTKKAEISKAVGQDCLESKLLQYNQLCRNFKGGGGDNLGRPQLVLSCFIVKF